MYDGRTQAPVVQLPLARAPLLYPVEPARDKTIQLDVTRTLVDLGPEGKLASWSFGGQIPGPTIRVRAGDRIRFVVCNRSDEPIAGLAVEGLTQSFETGGVLVDHDDGGRKIGPGQTLTLEVTAVAPGVHLYRGGLPSATEALAAGLYGMLVVDPADGFATPAAREVALVQGELYARAEPSGGKVAGAKLALLDRDALKSKRPSHFGYGGQFAAGQSLRVAAEPGERVRLFVLNAGPHADARFQVQGLPFASVWPASALGDKPTATGPVVLPPGQGAVVELVIPRKGRYRFGDQHLGGRGLVGLIDAAQGEPEAKGPLLVEKPRTATERLQRAHELFVERCVACHDPPAGTMRLAPDLAGVMRRRNRAWLVSWLTDPPKMQAEDPVAQELMRQWNNVPMPQVMLSNDQIEWMLEFLAKKG